VTNTQPAHRQHAIILSREKGEWQGRFLEKSSRIESKAWFVP
jgi:hypothetical protein